MSDLAGRHLGRYQLEGLLGRGGMAEVYRAHDERLDRAVAVKVIRPLYAEEPGFVERFLREARLVARLEHPHILPVYDSGEEQGRPYLVMPLVLGGTLLERLQAAPPPRAQIAEWLQQLGAALDAAHAKDILHRDVKPANVLVGDGDRLFLADFGIARMGESSSGLTATGTVVGTPLYLAPEVAQGQKATPASDRYSLAVIAYEMLGGSPPFRAENPLSILHQHVTSPVPPLTLRMGDLPPEVDTVFTRALAKQPLERPRSGRELAGELHALLSSEDGERTLPLPAARVRRADTGPSPGAAWQPTAVPTPPPPSGLYRIGRGTLWSLAFVVLILVGLSALKFLKQGDSRQARESEQAEARVQPVAAADSEVVTDEPAEATEPETEEFALEAGQEPPGELEIGRSGETTTREAARRAHGPGEERPKPKPGAASVDGDAWRTLDGRLSRGDFERLKKTAAAMPSHPSSKVIDEYADGGLAYMDGRSSHAIATLVSLLGNERSSVAWGGSVATLLRGMVEAGDQLTAWQVDLAYGDPGRLAKDRLEEAGASVSDNLALAIGVAVLARLDGRHLEALEGALEVWANERLTSHRSAVAQFIAEQQVQLGDVEAAVAWYGKAVAAGERRAPLVAFQAARSLGRDLGRPEEAARFLKVACDKGLQLACRELEKVGRPQSRRRRAG